MFGLIVAGFAGRLPSFGRHQRQAGQLSGKQAASPAFLTRLTVWRMVHQSLDLTQVLHLVLTPVLSDWFARVCVMGEYA